MADVNYKLKYMELKSKFINAIDTAFRLGMEQGMQQAQVQQAQQQQADAQAMQQAALQGQGQPGEDGGAPDEGGDPGQEGPTSENPQGSELDQHIDQLEQAMGKAEYGTELYESLKKAVDGMKHAQMLRKNEAAVRAIAKNMKKPSLLPRRQMNERARKNLNEHQKSTLEMQQQIVDDVFKHWDAEESDVMGKVLEIVGNEGKLKKE